MLSYSTKYTPRKFKSTAHRRSGNDLKIVVNGVTISYNDNGPYKAPAIIFIHGFPFNKSMWDAQCKALKDTYRVVAYDVRGHGHSESGTEEFTIDLFVSDLIGLMDALGFQKVMLCGLSMGGYIALRAIEQYPDRFEALVLSDTQCESDTPQAREKRLETIEKIKQDGIREYAEQTLKNLVAPETFVNRKEEIRAIREMILNTSKNSLYRTLLALSIRRETCSKLASIRIPVLVMVGRNDQVTPPEKAEQIHENIRESVLHFIDHAGHIANMENPAAFNSTLKKFVDRFAR